MYDRVYHYHKNRRWEGQGPVLPSLLTDESTPTWDACPDPTCCFLPLPHLQNHRVILTGISWKMPVMHFFVPKNSEKAGVAFLIQTLDLLLLVSPLLKYSVIGSYRGKLRNDFFFKSFITASLLKQISESFHMDMVVMKKLLSICLRMRGLPREKLHNNPFRASLVRALHGHGTVKQCYKTTKTKWKFRFFFFDFFWNFFFSGSVQDDMTSLTVSGPEILNTIGPFFLRFLEATIFFFDITVFFVPIPRVTPCYYPRETIFWFPDYCVCTKIAPPNP